MAYCPLFTVLSVSGVWYPLVLNGSGSGGHDGPYLVTSCCLLPYITRICKVEILVMLLRLQLYPEEVRISPRKFWI